MSSPPPEECPECKVVINGGRIASNANILTDEVRKHFARGKKLSPEAAKKVIAALNEAEDCVDRATREFLRGQGYSGPVNKALE